MILNLSGRNLTVIKDGVYYLELSDYPRIKDYEWNNIIAFINYEKAHGRKTEIVCEDANVLALVTDAATHLDGTAYIPPEVEGGEFVYHATDVGASQKILSCGKLLSAVKVYGKTGEELSENRKQRGWDDPADFFEYIMFGWGDHLVGDYVVLSENFPNDQDLAEGNFDAGVRFYIRYEDMIRHPGHTFDGYHAIKVKDEILLSDYLFACIVPEQYKNAIEPHIAPELVGKVHYLTQRGLTLTDWNDKVYQYVCKL